MPAKERKNVGARTEASARRLSEAKNDIRAAISRNLNESRTFAVLASLERADASVRAPTRK